MTSWTNFTSSLGAAVTTWNYDASRGWLSSKDYPVFNTGVAGAIGTDYTYTPGGRLKTRTWARTNSFGARLVTMYKYGFDDDDTTTDNQYGDLTRVSYNYDPQNTPGVVYTYDRLGRQGTVSRNGMVTTLSYDDANQLTGESNSLGSLNNWSTKFQYDNYLRQYTSGAYLGATLISRYIYNYDNASRLSVVSQGSYSATYSYLANSPLVEKVDYKQDSTVRMTTTRQYDHLNRLTSIANTGANLVVPATYAYSYNTANQRTRDTLADGSYWVYQYDKLGQVTSGKRYWADGTPVAGQQFEYGFDDIGNRQFNRSGGDATGANLRETDYSANFLNQYTQRTRTDTSAYFDVMGAALAGTSVTVSINGGSAQSPYRKGEYFRQEASVSGTGASLNTVTVTPSGENASGKVFVSPKPEAYTYDADGNLLSDGHWTYGWDAENRLIAMTNSVVSPNQMLRFEYDWRGRRIRKQVWNNTTMTAPLALDRKFLYDSWNLILTADGSDTWQEVYMWGLDLSGSKQGAGGVGGLVKMERGSGQYFPGYDGNGNVTELVMGQTGQSVAEYEYGPFGEVLRNTGSMSKTNAFRFSTKYQDDETDLLYYGYRFYNPSSGRWLSRDAANSPSELNSYAFVKNDGISAIDVLGLRRKGPKYPWAYYREYFNGSFHWITEELKPADRPDRDALGLAWIEHWDVTPIIKPCIVSIKAGELSLMMNKCSWHLEVTGEGVGQFWIEAPSAQDHELFHVESQFHAYWDLLANQVQSYTGQCMSYPKALCYYAATKRLAKAYKAKALLEAYYFDIAAYNGTKDEWEEVVNSGPSIERELNAAQDELSSCAKCN